MAMQWTFIISTRESTEDLSADIVTILTAGLAPPAFCLRAAQIAVETYRATINELPEDSDAEAVSADIVSILTAGLTPPAYCFSAELDQD